MPLSAYAIAILVLGLLAAAAGFLLAFRQSWLRRLVRRLTGRDPATPRRGTRERGEDPVHYAMIISGIMLMAFGILIAVFTVSYELLTAG
jgi:uncharacterized membrane protein